MIASADDISPTGSLIAIITGSFQVQNCGNFRNGQFLSGGTPNFVSLLAFVYRKIDIVDSEASASILSVLMINSLLIRIHKKR